MADTPHCPDPLNHLPHTEEACKKIVDWLKITCASPLSFIFMLWMNLGNTAMLRSMTIICANGTC